MKARGFLIMALVIAVLTTLPELAASQAVRNTSDSSGVVPATTSSGRRREP